MDQFATNYNTLAGGEAEVINLLSDSEVSMYDTESMGNTMGLTDTDKTTIAPAEVVCIP